MNRRMLVGFLVVLGQLGYLTSAHAQSPWVTGLGFGYAAGAYGGYGNWGAQTPFSAEYTGMANLVRSQGLYNESTARAAVSYQQARSQYIQNQQQIFTARQQIKRYVQADDAKHSEEVRAQFARSEEFLAAHRPPPLNSKQLDPSTGKLNWPATLRLPEFDAQRKGMEELFEKRVKYGPSADLSAQIEIKTGELKDSLRAQITKVPLPEYSESRQFLDNMASTAR